MTPAIISQRNVFLGTLKELSRGNAFGHFRVIVKISLLASFILSIFVILKAVKLNLFSGMCCRDVILISSSFHIHRPSLQHTTDAKKQKGAKHIKRPKLKCHQIARPLVNKEIKK